MRIAYMILFLLALPLLVPNLSHAASIDEIKKELEEVKYRLEVVEAESEDTHEKFSSLFEVGGYADFEFISSDKSGTNDSFRIHHLAFHFVKDITKEWRMFSEVEFEDGAKIGEEKDGAIKYKEGKLFVEAFYIEYMRSQYLNLRLGRFLTPGGIWNVEHYPPFVPTQERPQHIRKIFPQISDGLQFYGHTGFSNIIADYTVYASNGSGNTGHGDENGNKALGGRLKLKFPYLTNIEVGVSGYTEEDNSSVERKSYGADIKLQLNRLKFQGEYANVDFDPGSGGEFKTTGYYGQVTYGIKKWDVIYRYDWYDPDDSAKDADKTINTFAINYHFTPYILGKLETHINTHQDSGKEDYTKTLLSIAVYLGD